MIGMVFCLFIWDTRSVMMIWTSMVKHDQIKVKSSEAQKDGNNNMEWISSIFSQPLIVLIFILCAGSLLGQISIKGISLGASGVLFAAMVAGHFGYQIPSVIQDLGLSLFITAVGLQAGPRFFNMMRTKGLLYGVIGVLTVAGGAVTTVIVAKLLNLPTALGLGLMNGAMTSTPGLASALEATQQDPYTSVGYGIAYPFGVVAVIIFIQLLPRLLKVDLMKDLEETSGPVRNSESPEVITISVTNPALVKKTIGELNLKNYRSVVISRVIRDKRTIIALSDTIIAEGDRLVAVGTREDLERLAADVGEVVPNEFSNTDHIQIRKVTVRADELVGRTIAQLDLRQLYGVTVTRIERGGIEYSQSPKWRLEQGDVLTMVSSVARLNEVEKLFDHKHLEPVNVHMLSLSFILLVGVLIGMIPIPVPGLGTISLGVAGGPLFVALIIGHYGKLGPIHARYYQPSAQVIRDIGLMLFLAGAGTKAGQGLIEVFINEGWRLVIGGAIITIAPLIIGYVLARHVFRLSMIHSLGTLCGGMTSTPGLGALNQLTDSEEGAITYAAAYPFALIMMAVSPQILVFFM